MSSWLRRFLGQPPESAGESAPADFPDPAPEHPDEAEQATSPEDRQIIERCRPYTMTSHQRLLALIDAVRYIARGEVAGAFAECGVWRGGSVLAMIMTLQSEDAEDREIHLYDTFEGMTQPTELDTSRFSPPALTEWQEARPEQERPWAEMFGEDIFDETSVRSTLARTGYPSARLHFHTGDVLKTIPSAAPEQIALLRLDTDWYESTRHELEHLYPRLVSGGVLIIDDYGHWDGARRAVDEFFGPRPPLLHRIDYTGRILVKS